MIDHIHSRDLGVSTFTSDVLPTSPPPGDLWKDEIVISPWRRESTQREVYVVGGP